MESMPLVESVIKTLSIQLSDLIGMLNKDEELNEFANIIPESHQINPIRWGIFAEVSAGKSTLLNTLIDIDCLPTGRLSTTATSVHIVSASPDNPHKTAYLEPYLKDDYLDMLKWLLNHFPDPIDTTVSIEDFAINLIDNIEYIALPDLVKYKPARF